MTDDSNHTCGKGVFANAAVPERVAALLQAMAVIYKNHIRSLDPADADGKLEIDAYGRLMRDYHAAAAKISALADVMRSYRDLPMADHDMAALKDAASIDAMEKLVLAQESLTALLRDRSAQYREMLDAMKKG
jgi:hypothetical protein